MKIKFQTNGYLIEVTDNDGYTYLLSNEPIISAIEAWNEMIFIVGLKLYKSVRVRACRNFMLDTLSC